METKDKLTLCLVQYDVYWEDQKKNISRVEKLLQKYASSPDIILLPEMFSTGFTMNTGNCSETMQGSTVEWMKKASIQYRCMVSGSLVINDEGNYYNRFIAFHNGEIAGIYDKKHLFRMGEEHSWYTSGTNKTEIEFKGWKIAPFICYDLRFPVWMRNTGHYDLAVVPANWPSKRDDVWQTLLKARAIENLCYVAGVNRIGTDGRNIEYIGHSMVVHPRNGILNPVSSEEKIIETEISLSELKSFRDRFPAHLDADDFKIIIH
jgi:omega-amidase